MKAPKITITNPIKSHWPGDPHVDPFMKPVQDALNRRLETKDDAWIDIYNRAYEAVYNALKFHNVI